jgi:hypothetical protein
VATLPAYSPLSTTCCCWVWLFPFSLSDSAISCSCCCCCFEEDFFFSLLEPEIAPAPSPGSPESAVAACSLSSFPVLLFFLEEDDLNPSEWMRLEISLEARSTTPKQKKI